MRRKRDYQKKDFKNPFFPQKKKTYKSRRVKFFSLFFIVIIIFGLYFLNTSQYFKITDVEVRGNEYISQTEIRSIILDQLEKKRFLFFSQDNILFFSKKAARNELSKGYFFDEIKIKKNYFNTIEVEVKEKTTGLIWVANSENYYIDLAGTVIRKMTASDLVIEAGEGDTEIIRSDVSSGRYPVIYDLGNNKVNIGQPIISENLVDFVIDITEELELNADFDIGHFNIATSVPFNEITLITKEGFEVRFQANESAKDQVSKLLLVLEREVKNRKNLEYIDLRFGEKVFYK